MPCFFALLGLFFPRVIIALLYLFDRPYLTNAFQTYKEYMARTARLLPGLY